MGNKKKFIIAAILVIFAGLTIFSFANPSNNNKEPENNQQEEQNSDKDKENDNKETDKETQNNTTTKPVIKPIVNEDYYSKALEAVIKAEKTLETTSYESALALVNKVTSDKKEELSERLTEVKNSIDAKELVKTLAEKVSSALDKETMDAARTYRTTEDIVNKVNSLLNETLKEDLQEELETLALLLDDVKNPVVNIEDGAILSTTTKIEVEDANEITMSIQKDKEESSTEIDNNYEVKEEGEYTLTLSDKAFNSNSIKFALDLSNPIFNIDSGIYSNKDIEVEVTDLTFDYVEIVKGTDEPKKESNSKFTLKEDGSYKLTAYDKAGHTSVVTVIVDKTAPVVTLKEYTVDNTGEVVEPGASEVSLIAEVEDANIDTIKLNDIDYVPGTEIKDEDTYTLVATDKAGNITTIEFVVDTEAPTVTIEEKEYNGEVVDTLYYNKVVAPVIADQSLETVTLNGTEYVSETEVTEDGRYTLIATDKYGRTTTVNFVIDKTAPVVTLKKYTVDNTGMVVEPGASEVSLIAEVEDANIDTIKLNTVDYVPGTEIKDEDTYTLVATDKAGNITTIEFVVDTEAPTVTIEEKEYNGEVVDTLYYNKVVAPVITDQSLETVTLNGTEYVSGTEVTEDGRYTLIATDKYGRTTTVNFVIDKTAPVVTLKKYTRDDSGEILLPGTYNYSLVSIIEDINIDTVKLNDIDYVSGTEIAANAAYSLVATDKAGNETIIEFAVDTEAPIVEIAGTEYQGMISDTVYLTDDEITPIINDLSLETLLLNDEEFISGTVINEEGTYRIVAIDKFGNTTDVTFTNVTILVETFEDFKEAFATGGKVKLITDIEVDETLVLPSGKNMVLDMDGKKLTLAEPAPGENVIDPMIDVKRGSSLVITGNGTVDLEDNYSASFIFPRGEVTIENGNFLRATGGTNYGSFFVGISGSGGAAKLIIKDGYFDGGYYEADSNEFHNSRNLVNVSWGQYVRIYGGTFVGQNPAYGDEGMAYTNPNRSNTTYCQGTMLEGQHWQDTEIPSTYTISEDVTTDGTNRPVYTVTYTPELID